MNKCSYIHKITDRAGLVKSPWWIWLVVLSDDAGLHLRVAGLGFTTKARAHPADALDTKKKER